MDAILPSVRIWLKNIGASNDRLPAKWYDEGSDEGEFRFFVRFSEAFSGRDTIKQGDMLIYNAFVKDQATGRVCGVARVTSDGPSWEPRSTDDQWPWTRRVSPRLIVPLAGQGPTLADVGVDTPPMGGYKEVAETVLLEVVRRLAHNALPPGTSL